jgi:hypothetical protein
MSDQCNPIPENQEVNYGIDPIASLPNTLNVNHDQMIHNSIASSIDNFLAKIENDEKITVNEEAITKVVDSWNNEPSVATENKLKLTEKYNPYLPIIQLDKKANLTVNRTRISLDCRPFIRVNGKEKNNQNFYDDKNVPKKEDPNIKPVWLLKIMTCGNNLRSSFFWIELFKKSVDYEIISLNKGNIDLHHAFANICFVFHSFLYMMIELNFNIKDNTSLEYSRDSNNGEKYLYLLLGIEKQVNILEQSQVSSKIPNKSPSKLSNAQNNIPSGYMSSRIKFNQYFTFSNIFKADFLDDYFGVKLKIKSDSIEEKELLKLKVDKLWWKIEHEWKKDLKLNTYDSKDDTGKRKRWERLFNNNLINIPTKPETKYLKDAIKELIPKMVEKGGGNDESDIVLLCKNKEDMAADNMKDNDDYIEINEMNNVNDDVNLLISVKNLQNGSARLGKSVASRYFVLHMGLNITVLNYLIAHQNSTPKLKKLSYLLDFKGGATKTIKEGVKCGEIGDRNLIVLSFIIRQLFIYFYQEFVYFYTLFNILSKTSHNSVLFNSRLNDTYRLYLVNGKTFNYWDVHLIAKNILSDSKLIELCQEEFICKRALTGINNNDIELKKNICLSILKDILANDSVMYIISILSHRFPIEADVNVMNNYNLSDITKYHEHTVDLTQIINKILLHECLGDRRSTNKANTMLIAVAQEEVLAVSTLNEDKLATYIYATGIQNRGKPLNEAHTPHEIEKIINKAREPNSDEYSILKSCDRLSSSISQMRPKVGILFFPMSKNEEMTRYTMKHFNTTYPEYYKDNYNLYFKYLRRLYEPRDFISYQDEMFNLALNIAKYQDVENPRPKIERNLSGLSMKELSIEYATEINTYYEEYFINKTNIPATTVVKSSISQPQTKKQKIMVTHIPGDFNAILKNLAKAIVADDKDRVFIEGCLKELFKKKIQEGTYDYEFKIEEAKNVRNMLNGPSLPTTNRKRKLMRSDSVDKSHKSKLILSNGGGKKINTGLKKNFNGKIKNIYKLKGSKLYYIIYNKKLISVNQYNKDIILKKSKILTLPKTTNPSVNKSKISKYKLRIEQYKNKNLSDYFINKLKNYINNNVDKNNIYKIGINKIKVILKDIYKINK